MYMYTPYFIRVREPLLHLEPRLGEGFKHLNNTALESCTKKTKEAKEARYHIHAGDQIEVSVSRNCQIYTISI